ncbi:MAG TPA: NADH:ubiquinone oxidoreductase [Tabrizicola sp.]|nr:NADH:ubiquinone oxidoreductase [Tabrizicola sp.]
MNAPWLGGFVIGAAAGLVAFGALVVVGKFDLFPAAAMGGVVATVAGLILGLPGGASASRPTARVVPASAPVAAPAAEPVAFMATPAVASEGPSRLSAPRGGVADNLKEIEGIGPAMEKLVNEMGFFHFDQIANWSEADVAWVDANLKGFKGRVTRDRWVAQAKIIVTEGLAAFRERAKTNSY